MDEELRFHIDAYAADLERQGLSSAEAKLRARAEFGVVEARKNEIRDALGLTWLDDARADFRYAFRLLRQSPGVTAIAVVSLALGIGANTAVFSLMETVVWKLLPVQDPQQLRLLSWVSGPHTVFEGSWTTLDPHVDSGDAGNVFSYPIWLALHEASADIFAFKPAGMITASIDRQAELVDTEMVSGNAFQVAGLAPIAGRMLMREDDIAGRPVVAVITEAMWTSRFHRDPGVVGEVIHLNRMPVTIVGVAPRGYLGMDPAEHPSMFVPLSSQPLVLPNQHESNGSLLKDSDTWWVQLMMRVRAGMDEQGERARLDTVLHRAVWDSLPARHNRDQPSLRLAEGSRGLDVIRSEFGKPLLVLGCVAGLVLLIACANVANLLLARATARHREIGIRLALGAHKGRVVRQMFTEGLLLTVVGAAAGLLLGYCIRDIIPGELSDPWSPVPFRADYDWRVLLISVGISAATGILFSIGPAWRSSCVPANVALKEGSRSSMTGPHVWAGRVLVIFQISLSLMLLVGAGLFVHTLTNLERTELGFNPSRILLFDIDPPRTQYSGSKRISFYAQLQQRLEAVPGAESVSASETALVARASAIARFTIRGGTRKEDRLAETWVNAVGPRFFETMQLPIVSGRGIEAQDRAGAPLVAVVNREFARRFFPGQNPIGRTLNERTDAYQIVGVAADAHFNLIRGTAPPTVYAAFPQGKDIWRVTYEIKTAAGTDTVMRGVREAVGSIDRDVPVFNVRTQTEQIDATMSQERLFATLTTSFGVLALVLAAVGIYGVIAYSVTRRTNEIGIRMAVGAQRPQVLRMILRECVLLAAVGISIGLLATATVTKFISAMLYGAKQMDPLALSAAVGVLVCVAFVSAWAPARKASRLDPMHALRHE